MTERGTIGSILMGLGRITEEDVGKALAYQRDHGGYFGGALMACGLVTEEELEFGLASQFDLPYVFPDADAVDTEAAALVSPEWALTHLTLPIMRTADTLTVIVESPIRTKPVDDLRSRTDLNIELALASPSKIRELIRQVYARGAAADEGGDRAPMELSEAWDAVLLAESTRFGVSARHGRGLVWWDDSGTIRRRPLAGDWEEDLERSLYPPPRTAAGRRPRAMWEGTLSRGGTRTSVDVRFIRDESGLEYLFHPRAQATGLQQRFPPSAGIVSEIRLLARSGTARFVVTSSPDSLGHEILPHLPELLLEPAWRSIYINATDRPAAEEAFSHRLSDDSSAWATELETLRAFQFDVVTVDLSGGTSDWPSSALDVASVAFLLWDADADVAPAYEAGIRWHLHIAQAGDGELEWTLESLDA
jgi:type IV pilus assembly protein PilB